MTGEPLTCEAGGGGLLLPASADVDKSARAVIYFTILIWCFMGVNVVADIFMGAIEGVTSKKKIVQLTNGKEIPVMFWNPTVANLTLMALGSSAPEILLSVIELFGASFYAGELGPSTIVGSAAFNMMIIISVCVVVIPEGETRTIKEPTVFAITGFFSIFAYLWLIVILAINSPNLVEPWEGVFTFTFFPILVFIAYLADIGKISCISTDEGGEQLWIEQLGQAGLTGVTESDARMLRAASRADNTSRAARRMQVSPAAAQLSLTVPSMKPSMGGRVGFVSRAYCFSDDLGELKLEVEKVGADLESSRVGLEYITLDGSMQQGKQHFEHTRGFADILAKETASTITIKRRKGPPRDVEADKHGAYFWVEIVQACVLSPHGTAEQLMSGQRITRRDIPVDARRAMVQITEQDVGCGRLKFKEIAVRATPEAEKWTKLRIAVERFNGSSGQLKATFRTKAGSAQPGGDYIEIEEGELVFEHSVMQKEIEVEIAPKSAWENEDRFFVELEELGPRLSAAFDETAAMDHDKTCTVTIPLPSTDGGAIAWVMRSLDQAVNFDAVAAGNTEWKDQLIRALRPVDTDDDDNISATEWTMHFINLPWKVVFAFIPPVTYCGGWLCFIMSLVFIGGLTALIGDLAALLGCCMNMPDSITAITIVALGTSLPDTFASKAAAVDDATADAAIGNVTGSNSVNVFLGLGLPWMIAAIYWKVTGSTALWKEKYPAQARTYPNGGFIVVAGDLVFSVVVFTLCALCVLIAIIMRRRFLKAELGGPNGMKVNTSIFFVSLWVLYIALASWKVLAGDVSGGTQVMAIFVGIGALLLLMASMAIAMKLHQHFQIQRRQAHKDLADEIVVDMRTRGKARRPIGTLQGMWQLVDDFGGYIKGLESVCSEFESVLKEKGGGQPCQFSHAKSTASSVMGEEYEIEATSRPAPSMVSPEHVAVEISGGNSGKKHKQKADSKSKANQPQPAMFGLTHGQTLLQESTSNLSHGSRQTNGSKQPRGTKAPKQSR